jgi:hypothetical protein
VRLAVDEVVYSSSYLDPFVMCLNVLLVILEKKYVLFV